MSDTQFRPQQQQIRTLSLQIGARGWKLKSLESRWRFLHKLASIALVTIIVSALSAQKTHQPHMRVGLPQDWSHARVIFSRNALMTHPGLAQSEPRVLHQWLRQTLAAQHNSSAVASLANSDEHHRDWSFALGNGRVAAGMSPAKYGFDATVPPSCTNDFVVFGLNLAGSATQANLVALNNLYSGPGGMCGTGGPSVLFAYNASTAGGRIATSPIISMDGTKIAFVESAGTSSILHILTWTPGGTVTSPAVPASMVSITYAPSASNSRSSPWIDFKGDTIYVGANNGRLYKFTGVFLGTPALAGAPWPAIVSGGHILTGPVLDHPTGNLFLGDTAGTLFAVNSSTAKIANKLVVGSPTAAAGGGIVDAPMVDSSNGLIYAESSNDNISAVLVQATTSNLTELARARIGMASTSGTNIPIYDGSPDNNYFNNPSTGTFMACGTGAADTSPWLYTFNFAANNTLNTTPISSSQLLTSTAAKCSPITEFFNPNIGGGTDFFFFGLTRDCFPPATAGCVVSRQTPGASPLPVRQGGGTSSIIVDNQSTAGQASSIYFTNLAAPGNAVKLTQSGLR